MLTEWDEFRWLDFARVLAAMAEPDIVDARNLLDPAAVRRMGFQLLGDRAPVSRVVVAGGAGFLGSHLCDRLVERGDTVVCLDDLSTGSRENVAHLLGHDRFSLVVTNVSEKVELPDASKVDAVCNLASPASPPAYLARPFDTLAVGSEGTRRLLELAREHGARFLMASTSEIYGDPEVHPQVESYRGNVDPTGPRSVYDEAKRFSESLTMAMHRTHGVNVGIVRIFNTYGPRLSAGDGRVVSNFIVQALRGEPLTVYGDGSQTRSLCFVDDEIRGLLALLDSSLVGPGQHREPRRAHHARSGPLRPGGHGLGVGHRLRAAADRRPDPPLPRHHPGPARAGLGAQDRAAGGDRAHNQLLRGQSARLTNA